MIQDCKEGAGGGGGVVSWVKEWSMSEGGRAKEVDFIKLCTPQKNSKPLRLLGSLMLIQ